MYFTEYEIRYTDDGPIERNIMKKSFSIIFFAILLAFFVSSFASADTTKKTVTAVIEEGTNYVFHVLAVSRVNFNSDYAYIYKDTVVDEDKDYIYKQNKHLALSDEEEEGDLVKIIILFPAYVNLDAKDKIKEYYSLLNNGLKTGDFKAFLEKYSMQIENFNSWPLNKESINESYLKSLDGHAEIIKRIGEVYVRNFSVYDKRLWKVETGKMEKTSAIINDYLKYANLIPKWEAVTGLKFKADTYYVLMCRSIEGGPNSIALGYDRNVFYSDAPFSFLNRFVSHEVGSTLLAGVFTDALKSSGYKFSDLYMAYQNLAEFYNCQVLKITYFYNIMPESYHSEEYMKIYNDMYENNKNIPPKDMLTSGIDGFLKLQADAKNVVKE